MSFIKAENALKRSEELLAVGRPVDALEVLRGALFTRRFKYAWTEAMEEIVKSYVRLSFELREVKHLKEGFVQYRSAGHVASFERCVRYLLDFAQSRIRPQMDCAGDLEETERPEALLLRAFSPEAETEAAAVGKLALRDLWESFRLALDLTRAHTPFEDLYHEIARRACQFCLQFKRLHEFRRLCDLLRLHYSYLPRQAALAAGASAGGPQVVSGGNVETIARQQDTRMHQLTVALDLALYSVAFSVAEDLQLLMSKKRPTMPLLINYFARLADLFFKNKNMTFHAFALLRHISLARSAEAGAADDLIQAALASLADQLTASGGSFHDQTEIQAEKTAKLAALVSPGGATVPTTDLIFTEIVTKGLLTLASPAVQLAFHDMVDNDGLRVHEYLAPSKYTAAINRSVFIKAVTQTAAVYSRMPLAVFRQELCGHLPTEAEKLLLSLRRSGLVDGRIDYELEIVYFAKIAGTRVKDFSALEDVETCLTADRARIAELRKLVQDKTRKLAAAKTSAEEKRREETAAQDEKDKETLRKLKEEEARRKEHEMREKIKFTRELEKAKELDEKLKDEKLRKEYLSAAATGVAATKTLAGIVKEMEKQLELKIKKEIATKVQMRKSECKKVNLTAKVLRHAEARKIATEWKAEIAAKDQAFFDGIRQKQIEAELQVQKNKQTMVDLLGGSHNDFARNLVVAFKQEKLEQRNEKLQAKKNAAKQEHVLKCAREAIDLVLAKFPAQNAAGQDEEAYYAQLQEQDTDILKVDSVKSRDDFKNNK